MKSSNGKSYYINSDTDSDTMKQKKAEVLDRLNKDITLLINTLENSSYADEPNVKKLFTNWSGYIEEMSIKDSIDSFAYNINKGEQISICLVNKKTGNLNTYNEIMYVILHELAHVMTEKYEHNKEFWDNFKFLVNYANRIDIYDKIDYSKTPKPFCNQYIN